MAEELENINTVEDDDYALDSTLFTAVRIAVAAGDREIGRAHV